MHVLCFSELDVEECFGACLPVSCMANYFLSACLTAWFIANWMYEVNYQVCGTAVELPACLSRFFIDTSLSDLIFAAAACWN
jgi:hypothetical protein